MSKRKLKKSHWFLKSFRNGVLGQSFLLAEGSQFITLLSGKKKKKIEGKYTEIFTTGWRGERVDYSFCILQLSIKTIYFLPRGKKSNKSFYLHETNTKLEQTLFRLTNKELPNVSSIKLILVEP